MEEANQRFTWKLEQHKQKAASELLDGMEVRRDETGSKLLCMLKSKFEGRLV